MLVPRASQQTVALEQFSTVPSRPSNDFGAAADHQIHFTNE
jgi:hypothetical protein